MEVVSMARDCSPRTFNLLIILITDYPIVLFDYGDEQERIITICREAAKSTFSLTDLISGFLI